jgi:hypothetical protein
MQLMTCAVLARRYAQRAEARKRGASMTKAIATE